VALELSVVGLAGEVSLGHSAHRESHLRCSRFAPAELRAYRSIAVARAVFARTSLAFALNVAIEGDCRETVPTLFPCTVDEVHLRGVVLAVPDDCRDRHSIGTGIPHAPEGVVGDDHPDEGVKRRYGGDRDGEVTDPPICSRSSGRSLPWLVVPARLPGNTTDDYRVYPGGD